MFCYRDRGDFSPCCSGRRGWSSLSVRGCPNPSTRTNRAWGSSRRQEPEEVYTHDFRSQASGIVNPYGIYEALVNKGAVVVGTAYDTPQFAVESIELWLTHVGFKRYSSLDKLLILCDAGGSNSCRFRAWKYYLFVSLVL